MGWGHTKCCCCSPCGGFGIREPNSMPAFDPSYPNVYSYAMEGIAYLSSVPLPVTESSLNSFKALDEFTEITDSGFMTSLYGIGSWAVSRIGVASASNGCVNGLNYSTRMSMTSVVRTEAVYTSDSVIEGISYELTMSELSATGLVLELTCVATGRTRTYTPIRTSVPQDGDIVHLTVVFGPSSGYSTTGYAGVKFPCQVELYAGTGFFSFLPPFGLVDDGMFKGDTPEGAMVFEYPYGGVGMMTWHDTGTELVARVPVTYSRLIGAALNEFTGTIDFYVSGAVEMSLTHHRKLFSFPFTETTTTYTETTDKDWWQASSWCGGKLLPNWSTW